MAEISIVIKDAMQYTDFNVHAAFAQYFSKDKLNAWLYTLTQSMEAGNICLDLNTAVELNPDLSLRDLEQDPLVGQAGMLKPFILHSNRLYFQRFFVYEQRFVAKIKALISYEDQEQQALKLQKFAHLISNELFAENKNLEEVDWQKVACINAFTNRFNIISGGPGTGKTTTVTKLLALFLLEQSDAKISICAPTGKAAARLQESIAQAELHLARTSIPQDIIQKIASCPTKTIHSLLGYQYNDIQFKHNSSNTLDADILIVDECSMIDISLFYKLFEAIDPSRTVVVLLGDKNQLASVNAGSVFRDLCTDTASINTFGASKVALINKFFSSENQKIESTEAQSLAHPLSQHIIELQTSYRFSDQRGIGKLSKAVLQNDKEAIRSFFENEDAIVKFYKPEQLSERLQHAASLLTDKQHGFMTAQRPEEMIARMNYSTVLCATRDGKTGVNAVNRFIVDHLGLGQGDFYAKQLLMVGKNQAEEGIYNGDMGVVFGQESDLNVFIQRSKEQIIKLSPAQILSWNTAFAMTIHKSQGSEFDEVLIVLPETKDHQLLSRELLYTAITRAKSKVHIVGSEALILTISDQTVKRISGIADQF